MPRANRHFLAGHIWHLTHRCHQQAFLLRYKRDRQWWQAWLFQAKRRYGLCVLNYVVTSNHIHLLVRDRGDGEIARSMQLVAGRTAQAFNQRKRRRGAFWEDRYHATAVESGEHLMRCLTYIDLNMVRAGVVAHPRDWESGGYREIQSPPRRYRVIDRTALMEGLGVDSLDQLRRRHRDCIEEALAGEPLQRDSRWTSALAVGSEPFVQRFRHVQGANDAYRRIERCGHSAWLREETPLYRAFFGREK